MSLLLQLEYRDLPDRLQRDIAQYGEDGFVEADDRLLWYLPNAWAVISRPTKGQVGVEPWAIDKRYRSGIDGLA
jgi:hypothetical protein